MTSNRVKKTGLGSKSVSGTCRTNRSTPPRHARAEQAEAKPNGDAPWAGVRAAKVARAKSLIQDPNYPSAEVIQTVARLLARNSKIGDNTYL